jgi:hypothetical protein
MIMLMKKISFLFLFIVILFAIACNNSTDAKEGDAIVRNRADSLVDEIDDGHNVGMARMASLTRAQQEVKRLLDSIGKLPAKAKQQIAPYTARLSSLLDSLNEADSSMSKWMREYRWNEAFKSVEEKIKYLEPEKEKVERVKQSILNSIQSADSLLQREF